MSLFPRMVTLTQFKPIQFDFDVENTCFGVFVGSPTATVLLSPLPEGEVRPEKQIFIHIWPAAYEDLKQLSLFQEATCEQDGEREQLWIGVDGYVYRAPGVLETEKRDYSNCTDFPKEIAETIGDRLELNHNESAILRHELKIGIDMVMRRHPRDEDQQTLEARDWSFLGFWKLYANLVGLAWPNDWMLVLREIKAAVPRCRTVNGIFAWIVNCHAARFAQNNDRGNTLQCGNMDTASSQ